MEIIFEEQIVGVAHAGKSDEQHAGLRASVAQTHDDLFQRHSLRFPWRDSPSQTQGKLLPFEISTFAALLFFRLEDNPGAPRRLREKRRTGIAGEIDDDCARHAIGNAIVVRMVALRERDIHDAALAAVHKSVLYGQVVQEQDRCTDS